jgi:hypothetical protein
MKKMVFSFFLTVLSFSVMAQNSVDLKLNPEKNKVYRFKSESEQNVSQTVNGVEQTTSTSSKSLFSFKMIDVSPEFIVAEARFDTIFSKTNAMGQVVVINSANEGNMASKETSDVMSCIMHRLSSNPIYVKMEPTGKVKEIVNLAMLQAIILKDTASVTGMAAPMIKIQINNSVSPDALKSMIEAFTYVLPAREIKAGEHWTAKDQVNAGGMSLQINADYTLETLSGNTAVVNSESSIQAAEGAKPMEYSGARISYDGIMGASKADITIDTTTGFVIRNDSKSNIAGDLNVSVQGMSMQIPMKIISESNIVSVK